MKARMKAGGAVEAAGVAGRKRETGGAGGMVARRKAGEGGGTQAEGRTEARGRQEGRRREAGGMQTRGREEVGQGGA